MSADNWSKCPKCKEVAEKDKAKLIEKAAESYGKIEVEKYDDMVKKASGVVELEETLREDYEFYLEEDILSIKYNCSCNKCRFSYSYVRTVNVLAEL